MTERLQAARAAIDETEADLQRINLRMRELSAAADRHRAEADRAQAPRQEKRGLLATIFRRGTDATSDEARRLKEIDRVIATAQAAAGAEADALQVIAEIHADLQREADELHQRRMPMFRELREAQFAAAGEEITSQAMPEFFAAAEAFRQAYGRLCGLGHAHATLAAEVIERFGQGPGQPIGHLHACPVLKVVLPGFPVEEVLRGHPTLVGMLAVLTQRTNLAARPRFDVGPGVSCSW